MAIRIRYRMQGSWVRAQVALTSCAALVVLLVGCSMAKGIVTYLMPKSGPAELSRLSIEAEKRANDNAPVALDVVVVLEQKAFELLSTLRAADWFGARRDLMRQYQQQLVVHSWEVVPGQRLEVLVLPATEKVIVGTLVFADYRGDQAYRADVTGVKEMRLNLGGDDFSVLPF